ncbi:MAG: hypothetical protein IT557_01835 [Alphaproteobacteria bacterium]|nr:hypothetical protein [Alphaproteobacteria bacterium]
MTEAQRAYEARRAAKYGMTLEKWLAEKEKRARADAKAQASFEADAAARSASGDASAKAKKPGLISRLLGRRRSG